ncbi:unnamed protein product [Phytophthora fragariaefolia]|uniref:Unnamed protein product n=1 Tax=Phytophthora fragariaefolia TaxID=1490495 RepID=A0A9W7CQ20_9STRA|nr:unnamed protein product [Phytophthora fragariaefolia]
MSLDYGAPIVLPPIGPLFAGSASPTAALLAYESEEQREQYEEDMARYFGVPLPSYMRRRREQRQEQQQQQQQMQQQQEPASLRTPTSVSSLAPSSSPVRKDGANAKTALPLLQLDSPTQTDGSATEHSPSGEQEKLRVSRERNRLHAQRTRIRKRELLESLKERIEALQDEYELLKQAYDFHATAVCLLRLGNVVDVPCVHKLEQVGVNATEDRDEDGQLCEPPAKHDSDVDADHEDAHEHEKGCACHDKDAVAPDACTGEQSAAMSRCKDVTEKRAALRMPMATSPVARRSQLSPLHSIAPRFRGEEDADDEAVDTNLEEDLLMEIRSTVAKLLAEKYLEQLENELRGYDGSSSNSGNDSCENDQTASRDRNMREELYSDEEAMPQRRTEPKRDRKKASRSVVKVTNEEKGDDTTKRRPKPIPASVNNSIVAKEHFRACFVEVNPVQLRDIRTLVLSSQELHIHHLRTLSKNLFLFSNLKSVNLSNNQLDDSGTRSLGCLQKVGSSHITKTEPPCIVPYEGVCCDEAIAVNEFLLHFRLSVKDQTEKLASLSEQWLDYAPRRMPTQPKSKDMKNRSTEITTAATEFSQHLAEQLQQGGKHSSLQSLGLCYAEISRRVVLNTVRMANRLTALDLSFAFIGIPGAQVVAAALRIDGFSTLTQLTMRCNRTKSMGAQTILAALHRNERLTFLNLSHNEIRSDIVEDVVDLLQHNKVLSHLNLAENDLISGEKQHIDDELYSLRDAIVEHGALLSLGQLNCLGANEDQQRVLQDALDYNRITDDQNVLDSINTVTTSRPTDDSAPPRKRHVVSTMIELSDAETLTTVWQRKITRRGRVSIKWRMAVRKRLPPQGSPLRWNVVVSRKCEVHGCVEDEAATALIFHDEGTGAKLMCWVTLTSLTSQCRTSFL